MATESHEAGCRWRVLPHCHDWMTNSSHPKRRSTNILRSGTSICNDFHGVRVRPPGTHKEGRRSANFPRKEAHAHSFELNKYKKKGRHTHVHHWDLGICTTTFLPPGTHQKRHLHQKSGSPPPRFHRSGGTMCSTATISSTVRSDTLRWHLVNSNSMFLDL